MEREEEAGKPQTTQLRGTVMVIQTAQACLGGREVDGASIEQPQNCTQIILFLQRKNVTDNQSIKIVFHQMMLEQLDFHRQKIEQEKTCVYNLHVQSQFFYQNLTQSGSQTLMYSLKAQSI